MYSADVSPIWEAYRMQKIAAERRRLGLQERREYARRRVEAVDAAPRTQNIRTNYRQERRTSRIRRKICSSRTPQRITGDQLNSRESAMEYVRRA